MREGIILLLVAMAAVVVLRLLRAKFKVVEKIVKFLKIL